MEGCDEEVRSLRPICGLALTLCLFGGAAQAETPAVEPAWRQSPPEGVAVGDLVFRRGQGMWTPYFINMSTREKRFSHVGIVARVGGGTADILHSDAHETTGIGCVRVEDWRGFYSNTLECAVYRYAGPNAATEFIRYAVNEAVGKSLINPVAINGQAFIPLDEVYRKDFKKVYDSKAPAPAP